MAWNCGGSKFAELERKRHRSRILYLIITNRKHKLISLHPDSFNPSRDDLQTRLAACRGMYHWHSASRAVNKPRKIAYCFASLSWSVSWPITCGDGAKFANFRIRSITPSTDLICTQPQSYPGTSIILVGSLVTLNIILLDHSRKNIRIIYQLTNPVLHRWACILCTAIWPGIGMNSTCELSAQRNNFRLVTCDSWSTQGIVPTRHLDGNT